MEAHVHDLAVRQAGAAHVRVIAANSARRHERCVMEGVCIERVARIATLASMPVCPGLAIAIRRSPADIVHIHLPNPGAALAFLLSGHTGEVVITHHADTTGRLFLRQFSDPFVRLLMRRASRITVSSARYLDTSSELAPFRNKCCVVPHGIDIQHALRTDSAVVRALRQQFGDRLILAVGRLVPYKGFDILFRAMKHVDAKLILIGTGPQHAALASLAESEGVKEKITMLGHVECIGSYFSAASIFVLPSVTRAEAFGLVQLEAMAAGLAIINTDIDSGVPEVSIHGKTGITVRAGEIFALSEGINMLLERKDLRDQFGEAAKARVHSEYTADLMADRTMSIYSEVLGFGHGAAQSFAIGM